jgi:hypothetical protein
VYVVDHDEVEEAAASGRARPHPCGSRRTAGGLAAARCSSRLLVYQPACPTRRTAHARLQLAGGWRAGASGAARLFRLRPLEGRSAGPHFLARPCADKVRLGERPASACGWLRRGNRPQIAHGGEERQPPEHVVVAAKPSTIARSPSAARGLARGTSRVYCSALTRVRFRQPSPAVRFQQRDRARFAVRHARSIGGREPVHKGLGLPPNQFQRW